MLEVRLLGQFEVRRDGAPVGVPSRAAQSLLAYLLLTVGTSHRREKLAGLLWPDTSEENARKNLRHELWRLRQALEPKPFPKKWRPYLIVDELSIGWEAQSAYWLDVSVIQNGPSESVSPEALMETLALYRGELLPGFYDDWVVLERERVHAAFEQKMAHLLDKLIQAKRWQDTLLWGERWIALGQTPEPACRALMQAHAALGNMSQVAVVYGRCVRALEDDLGVEPSEQTRSLFEQLSRREKSPAAPEHRLEPRPRDTFPQERQHEPEPAPAHTPLPRSNNLPVPLTSFIGREREIKELKAMLSTTRLLTLTGAGGSGKTRLAIQLATELVDTFHDGVGWVDLAPLTDESLVNQAVAQALGVRESPTQRLTDSLNTFMRQKNLLLVLDNCEHLLTPCAQLAVEFLTHCPNLRILATSREALGVMGEQVYQVPTLSLPKPGRPIEIATLMQSEGVRLFLERARAVKSDLHLNAENAAAVLEICRRLDGIPLALELAAARTKLLTVDHLAERLNDRFHLLTQGNRTALPRQQTLRATIDWSYDLMPPEARLLFGRLSAFAGGFTLEAAEGVCSADPLAPRAVLDLLGRLVDRSLVQVERVGASTRYRMLESIREYAREKLEGAGETSHLRQRHRDYYVAFAEGAASKLRSGAQFEWLDRLEGEHDNLRAAWDCAIDSDGDAALRLASALLDFWLVRGNPSEGRQWLAQLLPRANAWGPTAGRAEALGVAGQLAYAQRDFAAARALLTEALAVARMTGDRKAIAQALLGLGRVTHRQHDDEATQALANECLTIYQELQDPWGMAMAIFELAAVAGARGDYAEAEERYAQSLAKFRELGDRLRAGYVLNGMGELARLKGDYTRAGKYYQGDTEILREQRSPVALVTPLVNQAWVPLYFGDYRQAKALFGESLGLSTEYGNRSGVAISLAGLAAILGMVGKFESGARLFGAVEAMLESIGMRGRMDPADQKEFNHYVAAVRAQLDPVTFAREWAEGRKMTMEQAIALALEATSAVEAD